MADLFIFASLNEGFGLALLEAMACGTPVLAARRGGVPEVVGDAGWLVDDPLNIEGYATAILKLLADRDLLRDMSMRGLRRSKNFSWKRAAEQTVELYREVANE
jgi:glycosyltransferase involved in cell wall biosynthesis